MDNTVAPTIRMPRLLRPLTQGRHRDRATVQELAALEGLSVPALQGRLKSGPRLSDEALVAVARYCDAVEDQKTLRLVLFELTDRVKRRVAEYLDRWGYTGALADDVEDEIFGMLYDRARDRSPENEFWEIRFGLCFRNKARHILDKYRGRRDNEQSLMLVGSGDGSEAEEYDRREIAADGFSVERLVDISAAFQLLESMPPRVQKAFYLKRVEQYAVESGDPDEPTVARALGVSGRQVRNYLNEAEKLLAEWRKENVLP